MSDVADVTERPSAQPPNFLGRLLARLRLPARDDNVRARPRECADDRAAEPARPSGDERDPPGQVEQRERFRDAVSSSLLQR
jgi:hypothetical protein